jgi:hypothetical protein
MTRQKLRYKSGQSLVSATAEAMSIDSEGHTCRGDYSHIENHRWMSEYEQITYTADNTRQFNDCMHVKFSGLPTSVQYTLDTQKRLDGPTGLLRTSSGTNIAASAFAAIMPHTELDYAPLGADLTKGLSGGPAMNGPYMDYLDRFESSSFDLDRIASSAFARFERSVARFDDISIINFIYELAEVKHMVLNLKRLARKQTWSYLVSADKLRQRDIDFNVSNSYLSWNFGYCPLMRDILTILRALANVRKRVKHLLTQMHKLRTVKAVIYQYPVEAFTDDLVFTIYSDQLCDGMNNYATVTSTSSLDVTERIVPKCGLRYSLFCPPLSEFQLRIRTYLETFGVAWDPVIVWNAIPFSFILDWIWDLSGWLDQIERKSTLPVQLRLWDFYIMWKYKGLFRCHVDHLREEYRDGPEGALYTSYTSHHPVKCERFRRVRFFPDKRHLKMARWDENVIEKTLLGASLATTEQVLRKWNPRVPKRFGPHDRTIQAIFYDLNIKRNTARNRFVS